MIACLVWTSKSCLHCSGARISRSHFPQSLVLLLPLASCVQMLMCYLNNNTWIFYKHQFHTFKVNFLALVIYQVIRKIIDSLPKPLWSASENFFLYWHFRVLFEYNTWHSLFTTYIPFTEFLHECCLENMILIFFFWWYFTVQYQIKLTLCPRGMANFPQRQGGRNYVWCLPTPLPKGMAADPIVMYSLKL